MANITISNLQPAGADLFGSEGLANSMRDLSQEELKIRGGKHGYSYSKKSFSKSNSGKKYPYYY
jgi:hypothetical protein